MSGLVWGQEGASAEQVAGPASVAPPTSTLVGATITGSVICTDTNGPARMAVVYLRSTAPSNVEKDLMKEFEESQSAANANETLTKEQEAAQKREVARLARQTAAMTDMKHSVRVGLDGSYRFTNVPPGSYQIRAVLEGYLDPLGEFSPEAFKSQDPAMREKIDAAAPVLKVIANEAVHVDLRLERGASINGRVLFEDGSPAIGWFVLTAAAPTKGASNPFESGGITHATVMKGVMQVPVTTDDAGRFRVSGLSSGNYVIKAVTMLYETRGGGFATPSIVPGGGDIVPGARIGAYSGNAVHLTDAKAIYVNAGDERTGVDIVFSLHQLHAVSGHVLAKTDAHAVNYGTVELRDKKDSSQFFAVAVHEDGSFRFEYVPGNSEYTLKTHDVQDTEVAGSQAQMGQTVFVKKTVRNYGQVSQEVVVMDSDLDGVNVAVPVLP